MSLTLTRQTETVKCQPLRRIREAADLSPEGLAAKAGVSLRTIERIEAGHVRHPHRATLNVLAAALEVDPEQLIVGAA